MAPSASKANYKSYEAQARMVRAIVAAHPDVKWNYKACYGSDMTEDALNHRFRFYRAEAAVIRQGRSKGFNMRDLKLDVVPKSQNSIDKNIAKYFGQSTGDGIQFQFRGIKKDADTLRQTAAQGGDVANCLPSISSGGGSLMSTPVKATPVKNSTPRGSAGGKRGRRPVQKEDSDIDDEYDTSPESWSDKDDTPSKRNKTGAMATPGQKLGTPSRRAAAKAADTIRDATAQLQSGDSHSEAETPSSSAPLAPTTAPAAGVAQPMQPYASIFGNPEQKPNRQALDNAFASTAIDPYVGAGAGLDDDMIYSLNGMGHDYYGDGDEC